MRLRAGSLELSQWTALPRAVVSAGTVSDSSFRKAAPRGFPKSAPLFRSNLAVAFPSDRSSSTDKTEAVGTTCHTLNSRYCVVPCAHCKVIDSTKRRTPSRTAHPPPHPVPAHAARASEISGSTSTPFRTRASRSLQAKSAGFRKTASAYAERAAFRFFVFVAFLLQAQHSPESKGETRYKCLDACHTVALQSRGQAPAVCAPHRAQALHVRGGRQRALLKRYGQHVQGHADLHLRAHVDGKTPGESERNQLFAVDLDALLQHCSSLCFGP